MGAIILALFTTVTGSQFLHAALVQRDGDIIQAVTDNQVANAVLVQSYYESQAGSCTIYEDFSVSGSCSSFALDPDADSNLDGNVVGVPQVVDSRIDTW